MQQQQQPAPVDPQEAEKQEEEWWSEPPKPKGLDRQMVQENVRELAVQAIGLDDDVTLDGPLMDSGMDSLTAVSFRNSLSSTLNIKLPSSLMFDYPTINEITNRIVVLSEEQAQKAVA